MDYTFRSFTETDIPQMHQTFLMAFSGYPLPFKLTYEEFVQKFIYKLNIDLSFSVGAFENDVLVGFIFTGIDRYRGMKTAYNGGTGVVPAHRGKSLTLQMYDYLWSLFTKEGIKQAALEVLTTNEKAIKNYQKCGFEICTCYHCFQLKGREFTLRAETPEVSIIKRETPNWQLYHTFYSGVPSYLDTLSVLSHNLPHEHLAEAIMGDRPVGYIIFQPHTSRISQLAVDKEYRKQGIGTSLLHYALEYTNSKAITLMNIDHKEEELIDILSHLGFERTVDQYEMIKRL